MKVHPVISIILGIITGIILLIISMKLFSGNALAAAATDFIISIIGGFIATYFAKEKKIRYGIYEGIILSVIFISIVALIPINYMYFLIALVGIIFEVLLPASIGGFIGKMTEENSRQTFKIKYLNRNLHPIIAIIAGILVNIVLISLFGFFHLKISMGITYFLIATVPFVVGGFVTAFLAREKKMLYGIYEGIIAVIYALLARYIGMIMGLNTTVNYYLIIGAFIGYLLAAAIGSYLGKAAGEHLKQKSEKSTI
jgi:uncharacterized membrane protein